MARQDGIIQLSGKASKPINQTEASKISSSDFGTATRTAARIRKAIKPLVAVYGDDTLINRLNKQLIAVLKTIPHEFSGNKKLIQGNVNLLNGFQFNSIKHIESLALSGDRMVLVVMGIHYLTINYLATIGSIGSKRAKAGSIVYAIKVKDGNEVSFLPEGQLPIIKVEQQSSGLDWELG